ncbi:MAG: N-acetylmuramoyl-L-alanine amidase [Burkholderiales bacterium]
MTSRQRRRILCALAATALVLGGCSAPRAPGSYRIDDSMSARGKASRVEIIVLHYTASSKTGALATLTNRDVSAHYVVSDDSPPVVYRLVGEDLAAWHAGESNWYGRSYINPRSIGIEIVHPGWNTSNAPGPDFPPDQIDVVIALTRDVARRHGVSPENIVGHSDVAPGRKQDPGPAFPWRQLALAGVGRWFDERAAPAYETRFEQEGVPKPKWFQDQLRRVGYAVPDTGQLDAGTRQALTAFQLHYRPSLVTGLPDAQTAARLLATPTTGSAIP